MKNLIEDGEEVVLPYYMTENGIHCGIYLSKEELALMDEIEAVNPEEWKDKPFSLAAEAKRRIRKSQKQSRKKQ